MYRQVVINQPPVAGSEYRPPKAVSASALLEEINLFACSPEAVNMYGGMHTVAALTQILQHYEHPIRRAKENGLSPMVDVRIHRLFADQFPCIPGWHCDFVPRGAYTAQPNFSGCSPHAFNVCLLLSDNPMCVSNTEYVNNNMRVVLEDPEHVYRELHAETQRIAPPTWHAPEGQFVWFNQRTVHRGTPARKRGIRLFMRFSMVDKPMIQNVHHSSPQVYVLFEGNGW